MQSDYISPVGCPGDLVLRPYHLTPPESDVRIRHMDGRINTRTFFVFFWGRLGTYYLMRCPGNQRLNSWVLATEAQPVP